jgi:hypothetical protein
MGVDTIVNVSVMLAPFIFTAQMVRLKEYSLASQYFQTGGNTAY